MCDFEWTRYDWGIITGTKGCNITANAEKHVR